MTTTDGVRDQLHRRAAAWGVAIHEVRETRPSYVAYGRRGDTPVVLKIMKQPGDEWWAGEVLEAFEGRGVARVLEHAGGATLLERLSPGDSLVDLAINGSDEEATRVLARVISAMAPARTPRVAATVEQWGESFDRYVESSDRRIPHALVARARTIFAELAASQSNPRLLHGDLQHSNVLLDARRGWLAIDPKGVVGEVEFEIGAALRNPQQAPELFCDRGTIERRVEQFVSELHVDRQRVVAWAFADAVLSAIWDIEDGIDVGAENNALRLAAELNRLL